MANIERRNALYSSLYEDTHNLNTGGFNDTEAGQLYKSTGNTDKNYIAQNAINSGRNVKEGSYGGLVYTPQKASQPSEWGQKYADRKGIKNPVAESAIDNGAKVTLQNPFSQNTGKETPAEIYERYYGEKPPKIFDEERIKVANREYEERHPDATVDTVGQGKEWESILGTGEETPKPQIGKTDYEYEQRYARDLMAHDNDMKAVVDANALDYDYLAWIRNHPDLFGQPTSEEIANSKTEPSQDEGLYSEYRAQFGRQGEEPQPGRPGGTYNGRPETVKPSEEELNKAYEEYLASQSNDQYTPSSFGFSGVATGGPKIPTLPVPRQGEEPQPGRPGGTYNGRPNYGQGNIDLNSRPILWNDDGSWSTVDSTIWGVDDKQVLMPTVIQQNGEWKHVDPREALQHYFDTGEHLGKFDTAEEAGAYGEQLHNDQAQQYYPQAQQQHEERRNSGRVFVDNAHGDMPPDARYKDIYNQLLQQGMSKEEILEWAESDGMDYMSPEEAMKFYIYVGNR